MSTSEQKPRECITHHHACACRELEFAKIKKENIALINELEADLKKTRAGLHLSSQNLAECEHERDELMEKLNGHGGALDQLRDARYAYTMKKNENAELRQDLRNAEIKLKEENAALKKRIIELDQATCDHSWDFTGVCEFCGAFGSIDYE